MSPTVPVHVPVARFEVRYEEGGARPYSAFEQLVLEGIHEGLGSTADIAAAFAVPERLAIEAAVTLIHAGWVGLHAGTGGLRTTPPGERALHDNAPPTTLLVRRPHPLQLVMERTTGTLARYRDATIVHRSDVEDNNGRAIRLPARVHDNSIDTSEIRRLIRTKPERWVRWIDTNAALVSKDAHVAIGRYDTQTGMLTGMPETFRETLEPAVRRMLPPAHAYQVTAAAASGRDDTEGVLSHRVPATGIRLVTDAHEHMTMLHDALKCAQSRVAVMSAFIRPAVIDGLAAGIEDALRRGVTIDLAFGYPGSDPASDKAAIDRIKKYAYDYRQLPGRIACSSRPSGSHAKVLLWDTSRGMHAAVGSYNWLSAGTTSPQELTVGVCHPGIAAELSRLVATQLAEDDRVAASHNRWVSLADQLERDVALGPEDENDATIQVALIHGRQHDAALRRAVLDPDAHDLLVCSDGINASGLNRLDQGQPRRRMGTVAYRTVHDDLSSDAVSERAMRLGMLALHRSVHAKVLVYADTATIGSWNYLSADPLMLGSRNRELSIALTGLPAAEQVRSWFAARIAPVPAPHSARLS